MKRITFALATAALLSSCMIFMRPPNDPALYEHTQVSAGQMYRASYAPAESIRVGKLHAWRISVMTADVAPVQDATITVDGGMPQHGHGLPTKPIVTSRSGNGDGDAYYMVEGMKFNMGGWWVVKVHIDGGKGSDVVTFNLKL